MSLKVTVLSRTTLGPLQTFYAQTYFWFLSHATPLVPNCAATIASSELRTNAEGSAAREGKEESEVIGIAQRSSAQPLDGCANLALGNTT